MFGSIGFSHRIYNYTEAEQLYLGAKTIFEEADNTDVSRFFVYGICIFPSTDLDNSGISPDEYRMNYFCKTELEPVSKMMNVQFRADRLAFQGALTMVYWR